MEKNLLQHNDVKCFRNTKQYVKHQKNRCPRKNSQKSQTRHLCSNGIRHLEPKYSKYATRILISHLLKYNFKTRKQTLNPKRSRNANMN